MAEIARQVEALSRPNAPGVPEPTPTPVVRTSCFVTTP
jgi:hypothetical protein